MSDNDDSGFYVGVFAVCLTLVLIAAAIAVPVSIGVHSGQKVTRDIKVACIQQHGTWAGGNCVVPR